MSDNKSEMLQMQNSLDGLEKLLKEWTANIITDKQFAIKAQGIIAFLKRIVNDLSRKEIDE